MRGRKTTSALRKSSPKNKEDWLELTKLIEEQIAQGTFKFKGLFASSALGKKVLSTYEASDALVLRKINDNMRRSYGIRQTQRTHAVKLVGNALSEWTPKGIVSVDLKSCFESITPREVIEKLKVDGRVSHQTIYLLETFFRQTRAFGSNKYAKGLPRGVLISSTLAEIFLKEIDDKIANAQGLYVYLRYVDDIFALAAGPAIQLFEVIAKTVQDQGLTLNKAKSVVKDAGCKCDFECAHTLGGCPCSPKCTCAIARDNFDDVDYLGYKFVFSTGKRLGLNPSCYRLIADGKAKKIKSRVASAISDYRLNKNYDLLLDRIKFLTKNVTIDKTLKKSRLKSGLAFTYDQYLPPPIPHPFQASTIEGLDKFLRTKLRRLCSSAGMSYMQTRNLTRNSFYFGHKNRHRISFDSNRMRVIRSCWNAK